MRLPFRYGKIRIDMTYVEFGIGCTVTDLEQTILELYGDWLFDSRKFSSAAIGKIIRPGLISRR